LLVGATVLHTPSPCQAQSAASDKTAAGEAKGEKSSRARDYFTDVLLVDQNGKSVRFYSDLIKGKVVIINSFFSTCQGVCPVMARNLEMIQQALGDRLGKDAHIISISVDPNMDTPLLLKDFAGKFHAKPGWYFITGKKENVDLALKKLGQQVQAKEDHTNLLIIGNDTTGLWKKAFGLAKAADLIKVVESVLNDKQGEAK
jgi:protein SCO1/2